MPQTLANRDTSSLSDIEHISDRLLEKIIDFRKEHDTSRGGKKKDKKGYLGYIRKQLKAAEEDGVKLSQAEVKKLGIMIQPLIQNKRGTFLDILSSDKKRLEPTYENLLRWTESPDRYDFIGVETTSTKATVKAKRPKEPSIFDIIGF